MLKGFLGLPGAGKGIFTVIQTEEALRTTNMPIVTNFAFRVMPWRRTLDARRHRYREEQGFMHYLLGKYGESFEVENRIHVLSDAEFMEFFLYRVDFEGTLVKADCTREAKSGKIVDFDKDVYARTQPCIYIMDEAWKFVWARNWQSFSFGFQMYMAQHRHAGDDVWMSFQTEGQPDKAVRDMIQEWHSLVNHKHRKIGLFKQPNVISVFTSNERPSQREKTLGALPKMIKFDPKGVGSCFDTAGAIGGTSVAGDIERKVRGLPTWGLAVLIVVAGLSCWMVARAAGWVTGKAVTGGFAGKQAKAVGAQLTVPQNPFNGVAAVAAAPNNAVPVATLQPKVSVFMVGFAVQPVFVGGGMLQGARKITVYLSDGSRYHSGDGHLTYLCEDYCVVDGQTNEFRSALPLTSSGQQNNQWSVGEPKSVL